MVDGEQSAPGQPGHDIVAQVALLQLGQQDDPALASFGIQQCLTHLEHRVGPHDLGFAEVEFHLAGASPRPGDVQAHGESVIVPLPLVFDEGPQLLRTEGADAHCGSSSNVHWT